MNIERDRVISISLSESEWQAFTARQPRPVDWLRARILDEVSNASRNDPAQVTLKAKALGH
ncbi:MAG: hypothetical protein ABJA98_12155 [Acidobacteriota bacterium]